MSNPLISIIVPIYNVELYLDRCISSLINQSYYNIEIILVNDGSPDNSYIICEHYALKDRRIKIINQDNQGVTSARYNGLKFSNGEFIMFVDGDDFLPLDAVSILVQEIETNVDIIIGNSDKIYLKSGYIPISEYRKYCITGGRVTFAVWGHLYRKTLFNKDIFEIHRDIKKGEDMIMNIRLAFRTENKVKVIPQIIYNYTNNPNSIIQTFESSLDYEYIFQKYLQASIPKKSFELYKMYYIKSKIRTMLEYICTYPKSSKWKKHPYYIELLLDIREKGYKDIRYIEKQIICSKYDCLRLLFIHIYSIKSKFL